MRICGDCGTDLKLTSGGRICVFILAAGRTPCGCECNTGVRVAITPLVFFCTDTLVRQNVTVQRMIVTSIQLLTVPKK